MTKRVLPWIVPVLSLTAWQKASHMGLLRAQVLPALTAVIEGRILDRLSQRSENR